MFHNRLTACFLIPKEGTIMRLIMLRHGKAVDADNNTADDERTLSREGRAQLEKYYPTLAHYLRQLPACQVWTSPLVRARESADILCRYLPQVSPRTMPFISTPSFSALSRALTACQMDDTVVLIGHEPFLSDWVRQMTGLETHFRKGRGMLLYLQPDQPDRAIAISPLDFDAMAGLRTYLLPLDVALVDIIRSQHDQIEDARRHFLSDSSNPLRAHDMRVALRVQYALLEFIRSSCDPEPFSEAEECYKALYDQFEELRSMDAISETIRAADNPALEPLNKALAADRKLEMVGLKASLKLDENADAFDEALNATVAALATVRSHSQLSQLVDEQFQARYHDIRKYARKCDIEAIFSLEHLRDKCKTLRYIFEFFGPLANYTMSQRYYAVRHLNSLIGKYADTRNSILYLNQRYGRRSDPDLHKAMEAFAALQAEDRVRYRKDLTDQLALICGSQDE